MDCHKFSQIFTNLQDFQDFHEFQGFHEFQDFQKFSRVSQFPRVSQIFPIFLINQQKSHLSPLFSPSLSKTNDFTNDFRLDRQKNGHVSGRETDVRFSTLWSIFSSVPYPPFNPSICKIWQHYVEAGTLPYPTVICNFLFSRNRRLRFFWQTDLNQISSIREKKWWWIFILG